MESLLETFPSGIGDPFEVVVASGCNKGLPVILNGEFGCNAVIESEGEADGLLINTSHDIPFLIPKIPGTDILQFCFAELDIGSY